ncbi:MAG: UbiD family decarboxylase [Peptostreptococcaceae bacterium]
MKFGELFNKCLDFVDDHRKSIITASLSILGLILLAIIFFVSSDELSVGNESNILLKNIEQRKYSIAIENYEKWEKQFSTAKMNRLNKSVSKKINKLLLDSGDKYISDQISKEYYLGLINTINVLEEVDIDLKRIVDQASRVDEMYKSENIKYDKAISYINTISVLNGIGDSLDLYKHNIKQNYESRNVFQMGIDYQQNLKYYEAIQCYDKVLEDDKKYYDLAKKNKEECIESMYDYYIEQSKEANKLGNYEEALQYIEYLKNYYSDDETISKLESEYQTNLSMYTLSADDILNLIARKSEKKKENLSVNSFQQMIGERKYYYVEVFEYDKLIDEVLVDAKDKLLYSYKDTEKDYKTSYSDGYFRVKSDGTIQIAISQDKAKFNLENKLQENNVKYKSVSALEKEKIYKYVSNKVDVDKILENEANMCYYLLVNKGLFKEKEVYIVNMYSEKVYQITKKSIEEY